MTLEWEVGAVEADFGHYRLLNALGEGGMGQVFRAYDTVHDREVALKLLAPQVARDPGFEQRFRREAHIAARMNEPHVVPIHSYGEIDGRLYVDMRLVAGRDLAKVLHESGPMPAARAVGIVEQVADALDAAHAINLIHRDIKPSNILLGRRDFVYLIDFGIAQDMNATRLTQTGGTIGTFAYMSPERIDTGKAGPSSDTYSLACVLYECLTGQLPFPGDSLQQHIVGHLSKPVPRPSLGKAGVSAAFDEVIAGGMAKNPADRYSSVTDFAEAARRALGSSGEIPLQDRPTQLNVTQQAPPLPWGPPPPGPDPWGPPPVGPPVQVDAVLAAGAGRAPGRGEFFAPGVLIMIFAVVSALLLILSLATGRVV